MKNISKNKLKELEMDELKGAKMYKHLGLHAFEEDEERHAKFFRMMRKKK